MTVKEIMTKLESLGSEQIKNIHLKHGVKEPFFGVKVGDMKPIQKKIKKDYQLAKDLYATGNADAMYLAGLIADDEKMTKKDLQTWVKQAVSNTINEYTVPWVAAEGHHGYELGLEWIDSKDAYIASAGWSTLANLAALKPDSELDLRSLKALLTRIEKNIHTDDWERFTINTDKVPGLRITGTPCMHGSDEELHRIAGHVLGFILEWDGQEKGVLYISGDTVYFKGVEEVGQRFTVDTAILHIGRAGFPVLGDRYLTFTTEEAIRVAKTFYVNKLIPTHQEGWEHFQESRTKSHEQIIAAGLEDKLVWLTPGTPVEIEI